MNTISITEICCPNCGKPAERHTLLLEKLIRTQCPACDYLMILCAQTAKVVEAYAPGISASHG
ncbi:replication restart DNA helicase PriA [Leptodesmis sichuanensis]|uniref:replication restart DNA helicase PriA n=1 Tax=Leptodesmis sichuanensis TaxID=2906798 RepID=UPI001F359CD6|nr:replication restart DNA helicase PriA [Leptodesmis sichuanensis]UIE36127.1 replication restart DNA helicase PriA [Leptodesmis sichuanensis A121]